MNFSLVQDFINIGVKDLSGFGETTLEIETLPIKT